MGLVGPFGEQMGRMGHGAVPGAVSQGHWDLVSHRGDITGSASSSVRQKLLMWIWTCGMKKPRWN